MSDTEGRAGRSAGGREQPARGGSVPAWSGPIRSCVSEGIQSGGRAGCALRRERRQRGASSGRRAAQAAAPARPALRAAGAATAAAPPPATAPPAAVSRPGTERPTLGTEVSPGLAAAAARDPPLPARRARTGMRGSGGRGGAWAAGTEARPGPSVPQPGPPSPRRLSGRWVWPPLGADAGWRHRPDAEVAVLPFSGRRERTSRRAGGGAGSGAHLRAQGKRVAAALRRGPARPGSESAAVPRRPSPARAPPSTHGAE